MIVFWTGYTGGPTGVGVFIALHRVRDANICCDKAWWPDT